MFRDTKVFSSFSVDDIPKAKAFYAETLGLEVSQNDEMGMPMLTLHLAGGGEVLIYPKDDHQPATHTVLNFPVPKTEDAVAALEARGVTFEDLPVEGGPNPRWFRDPAGNWLQVLEG